MKRITLFIASLSSGGAEHQLCILAKFLKEKGLNDTLVIYSDADDHYLWRGGIDRKRLAYKKNRLL